MALTPGPDKIGKRNFYRGIQILLLERFYQIPIRFHGFGIFDRGPIRVGCHKDERDIVVFPDVLAQIDSCLVGGQDNIDKDQVYLLRLQHIHRLLIHDHIVHNLITDLLKHGLHVVRNDHIILYNKYLYGLFQERCGLDGLRQNYKKL